MQVDLTKLKDKDKDDKVTDIDFLKFVYTTWPPKRKDFKMEDPKNIKEYSERKKALQVQTAQKNPSHHTHTHTHIHTHTHRPTQIESFFLSVFFLSLIKRTSVFHHAEVCDPLPSRQSGCGGARHGVESHVWRNWQDPDKEIRNLQMTVLTRQVLKELDYKRGCHFISLTLFLCAWTRTWQYCFCCASNV